MSRIRKIESNDGKSTWVNLDHRDSKVTETDKCVTMQFRNDSGEIQRSYYPKKNIKSDREYKEGLCYITTACVEAAGLPDDCHELETLREFRENYVMKLQCGSRLLKEYREISPIIIAKIKDKPNSKEIFQQLLKKEIRETVSKIEKERYADALICYVNMTNRLKTMK